MHFSHLKCAHVLDIAQVQPSTAQLNCRISLVKNVPTLMPASSFKRPHTCKGFHLSINLEQASHVSGCRAQGLGVKQSQVETATEDIGLESCSNSEESFGFDDRQDVQTKRRVRLAKKRNVPWNKGKKHSAETREWISYKTKEALRDPKVRKKMSEHPRPPLSKQTKARISVSQARLWDERLKWKRSRQKFLSLWSDGIAKAAKRGGPDQDELDWDSYEKLEREIALDQLQQAAERAEAKLMKQFLAKKRAADKARAKAAKMEKLALKKIDDEERARVSGKSMRNKRSKEEREELAAARELKLRERLTKIHKKKSKCGHHINGQDQKVWDSLDLESLEKKGNEASLADKIQAIRTKRAESVSRDVPQMASFSKAPSIPQVQLVKKA